MIHKSCRGRILRVKTQSHPCVEGWEYEVYAGVLPQVLSVTRDQIFSSWRIFGAIDPNESNIYMSLHMRIPLYA